MRDARLRDPGENYTAGYTEWAIPNRPVLAQTTTRWPHFRKVRRLKIYGAEAWKSASCVRPGLAFKRFLIFQRGSHFFETSVAQG